MTVKGCGSALADEGPEVRLAVVRPLPSQSHDLPAPGDRKLNSHVSSDVALFAVAWVPRTEIDEQRWVEVGRRLGRVGKGTNWWVGDWVRYGAAQYGDRYKLAAKVTGYDRQTLMNYAYVASRFEVSRRRPEVSWSHHAELAPLVESQQTMWLERVIADRLSLRDLRAELRDARTRSTHVGSNERGTAGDLDLLTRCPACGQRLPRNHPFDNGALSSLKRS